MIYIKTFLFGIRAQGEQLPEPKLPAERALNSKEFEKWCKKFKVGSKYGHRGSFYQRS